MFYKKNWDKSLEDKNYAKQMEWKNTMQDKYIHVPPPNHFSNGYTPIPPNHFFSVMPILEVLLTLFVVIFLLPLYI